MGIVDAIYDEVEADTDKANDYYMARAFPIDISKVKSAQPGPNTHAESAKDPRAPADFRNSTCVGCRGQRGRNDWTHSREIGQCYYPYDEPWIPKCEACVKRITIGARGALQHTLINGECKFATNTLPRASSARPKARAAPKVKASPLVRQTPPHEVRPQSTAEETAYQPTRLADGSELGQKAEDELARLEAGRAQRAEKAASSSTGSGGVAVPETTPGRGTQGR